MVVPPDGGSVVASLFLTPLSRRCVQNSTLGVIRYFQVRFGSTSQ